MAQQQADLTTMWKALEADAALIEALITPMVQQGTAPTLEELQRGVAAIRHFQDKCNQTKAASLQQQQQYERMQHTQRAQPPAAQQQQQQQQQQQRMALLQQQQELLLRQQQAQRQARPPAQQAPGLALRPPLPGGAGAPPP